ncbi:uncharacterized protein LOC115242096 [Formica exsecta]|uniref:uncharacterized protein LOC115242096 n=1 Tax=Formica exsecta TaxID=72781 RepID=UPI001144C1D2|nr:uncharacterized protein LOC115242096 [Formica exsecta]
MSSSDKFKCGYCGWIVWRNENGQVSHGCFAKCKELLMDKDRNLFRNDSLGTHLHVGNEIDGNNTIEKSTAYKENIEEHTAQDTEKLDEDLISAVKERPVLYDFRIPVFYFFYNYILL